MQEKTALAPAPWFSIKQAAEYLDIGEPTLYRWMKEGSITFRKVGDSTRFLKEDLDNAVQIHWSKYETERVRATCPVCHHDHLIEGHLQSTGKIYFRPKHAKFWTLKDSNIETTARICQRCGAITWYGDMEKLNAIVEKSRE